MRVLTTLAMLLWPVLASAQDAPEENWKRMGGNERNILYIDPETIKEQPPYWQVWALMTAEKLQPDLQGRQFGAMRNHYFVNCKSETVAAKTIQALSDLVGRGTVIFSITDKDESLEFRDPPPRTIQAALVEHVCKAAAAATPKP